MQAERKKTDMFIFKDQPALVTGGASGIGLAIARALGEKGCKVVIADYDEEALKTVSDGFPGTLMTIKLDVRDREGWKAAKEKIEAEFGPLAILVNNAGVMDKPGLAMSKSGLVDYSFEQWDRMIAINLTGAANGIMTFGGGMRDRQFGHIVNTCSTQGLIPTAGVLGYSVAKNGLVALGEALRDELAPSHVGVTNLVPGVVATHLAWNELKQEGVEMPKFTLPGGMDPADVAAMVIDGIENNKPFVITHGEYAPYYNERVLRIQAAFAETPVSASYDPTKPLAGTREWAAGELKKEQMEAAAAAEKKDA